MEETAERCLKCGEEHGLQGVAVTIGRKTFDLFYLCTKCGDVAPVSEQIYTHLKRMILSGKLKKGQRCRDRRWLKALGLMRGLYRGHFPN